MAGVLFLVTAGVDTVAHIDVVYDSPIEYLYLTASMLAFLGVVVAVIGVHASKFPTGQLRGWGTVAVWLTGTGYGVAALLNAVNLIQGERSLVMVRLGFAVVMLIGSAILGVVVLKAQLLPWWCGVLAIVAFPVGHFANALFPSAENILMGLLWGSVGIALLARADAPMEPATRQPTRVS